MRQQRREGEHGKENLSNPWPKKRDESFISHRGGEGTFHITQDLQLGYDCERSHYLMLSWGQWGYLLDPNCCNYNNIFSNHYSFGLYSFNLMTTNPHDDSPCFY